MQVVSKKIIISAYKSLLEKVSNDSIKRNLGPEPYFVEYLKMMRDVIKSKEEMTDRERLALESICYAIEKMKEAMSSSDDTCRAEFYEKVAENIEEWTDVYANIQ